MFLPDAFREDDPGRMQDAIEACGLGLLVTRDDEGAGTGFEATPVPMLLDRASGPQGTLLGHLARGNPMVRLAGQRPALAAFLGPNAYVSPSYYPSKQVDGRVVPTWNYVSVHAHGALEFCDDPAFLRDMLERLTTRHEAGRERPWAMADAPEDYIRSQLAGIVGFRLRIGRLEGKVKMSQNRAPADREGAAGGLAADGRHEVAALIWAAGSGKSRP